MVCFLLFVQAGCCYAKVLSLFLNTVTIGSIIEEHLNYIKRELQASLSNTSAGTRNGILGVVLPEMYDNIYTGTYTCSECGSSHNGVKINDDTTVSEFNYNYYLPLEQGKCAWTEEDRYCALVKWEDFIKSPNEYIDKAFEKRNNENLTKKIKVRP